VPRQLDLSLTEPPDPLEHVEGARTWVTLRMRLEAHRHVVALQGLLRAERSPQGDRLLD
jgi:hypothetical protein